MKIPYSIPLYLLIISTVFFGFMLSMFMQQSISLGVFNIFLGTGGLMISAYIMYIKLSNKTMVCPTGSDCNKVIFSEYSKFFGMPLEYLGILYYTSVIALYSTLITNPGFVTESIVFGGFIVTAGAFLFSLYLTSVQGLLLKQWCMWCLLSAVLSSTIFVVSFGNMPFGLSFLTTALPWLYTTHFVASSLGIGGVTLVTIIFFKFLKDLRISSSELGIMKTMFEVVWFSLAIFTLTEFSIYLTSPEMFISSSQFIAKIIVLALIVILSVLINLIIMPFLTAIDFGERNNPSHKEFTKMRKISFGLGGIYITSWFFMLATDIIPQPNINFSELIGYYSSAVVASLFVSQIIERLLSSRTPVESG